MKSKKEHFVILALKNLSILAIVLYSGYTVGFSVYRNYQINEEISRLKAKIAETKVHNQDLSNLIMFYNTKAFAEIEARGRLNLKKPDEQVFVVNLEELRKANQNLAIDENQDSEANVLPATTEEANYSRWYKFLLHNNQA